MSGRPVTMSAIRMGREDTVLVVAPHPDDELIATGLLLQEAVRIGARVHVVLVTHGDAFGYTASPTPTSRGPRIRRINLGHRRSHESLRALARIGITPAHVTFMGYPDRGLSALWNEHWKRVDAYTSPYTGLDYCPYEHVWTANAPYAGEQLLADLMQVFHRIQPTILVFPHPRDAHYDHAACSAFVTCALEQIKEPGGTWVDTCRRYYYLVHRGSWPTPRGLNPRRELRPPVGLQSLSEDWHEVRGNVIQVAQKHNAIRLYRSQFPLVGRFLLSFVGVNEIFAPPAYPRLERIQNGVIRWRGGVVPWPRQPLFLDPVKDSLTRQVERSADIAWVRAFRDDVRLWLQIGLVRRPVVDVEYRISVYPLPRREAVHFRLRPPRHVGRYGAGLWRRENDVILRSTENSLEVAFPGKLAIPGGGSFFIQVATRYRGISIDRTGIHYVQADHVGWV